MANSGEIGRGSIAGRRIVVTRAVPQAEALISALDEAGAVPIPLPLLELVDPADGGTALRDAVSDLDAADWLVALSPNGAKRIVEIGQPASKPNLAVIAGGTGSVFIEAGWSIDLLPEVASSAGLLDAFEDVVVEGAVLIAQAEDGRRELAEGLATRGVDVEVVAAYRNVMPSLDPERTAEAIDAEAVVFASPSAVERYVTNVGQLPSTAICIGSVTAAAAVDAGFDVTTSQAPTIDAIMTALTDAGC